MHDTLFLSTISEGGRIDFSGVECALLPYGKKSCIYHRMLIWLLVLHVPTCMCREDDIGIALPRPDAQQLFAEEKQCQYMDRPGGAPSNTWRSVQL